MPTGYILTERDRAIVAETIRQVELMIGRSLRGLGSVPTLRLEDIPIKSFMYVARAPINGIPALDVNTTGTGTTALGDDEPGYADCEIYQLMTTDDPPRLRSTGFTLRVYNLQNLTIPPNQWVTVTRDEYGTWWATSVAFDFAVCP